MLKHCATNRKRQFSALPNVSIYIYIYTIYIYIYIYDISRLRVKIQVMWTTNNINVRILLSWYPCSRVCWLISVSHAKPNVLVLTTNLPFAERHICGGKFKKNDVTRKELNNNFQASVCIVRPEWTTYFTSIDNELFVYTVSCGYVHMLLHSGWKAKIRIIIVFGECAIELGFRH
jgi:hypothetical protein